MAERASGGGCDILWWCEQLLVARVGVSGLGG